MKTDYSGSVYIVTLTEHEWNKSTDETRQSIYDEAMHLAKDRGMRYVNVLVEPDDLFSTIGRRQSVFSYTFPTPVEVELEYELINLMRRYVRPGQLSLAQARNVALKVFGE